MTGTLSMMACAFLWSVAGLFIKLLEWNPFLIAGMRSLIAFFFLLAIVRTVRLACGKVSGRSFPYVPAST
jgi:EamA domain-containing membrane protein RarD